MGHVRTSRWLIAGTTTLALVATPLVAAVPARAAAPHVEVGLYGTTDPTYDGVFRQSLAILGLHAAGIAPRPEALAWLERQQCADGGFPSYNPDPSKPCPAFDPGQFTGGEDTNATALAAQALLVAGRPARATRAVTFLRGLQNPDGGWELIGRAGSGSDPNSTGLVLTALSAAKVTRQGQSAVVRGVLRHVAGRTPGPAGSRPGARRRHRHPVLQRRAGRPRHGAGHPRAPGSDPDLGAAAGPVAGRGAGRTGHARRPRRSPASPVGRRTGSAASLRPL